ncbi:hypothetical protein ACIRL0_38500 [Streptomyces sp. NPDC102365]|uniref:hypothetical protein n=1 Tax=Streptomyces sp. NPDC102365 TaxID=3366162 RepID=UPI003826F2D3
MNESAGVLFVLDNTGPAGIEHRVRVLRATAREVLPDRFLREVPLLSVAIRRPLSARVEARTGPRPESELAQPLDHLTALRSHDR